MEIQRGPDKSPDEGSEEVIEDGPVEGHSKDPIEYKNNLRMNYTYS